MPITRSQAKRIADEEVEINKILKELQPSVGYPMTRSRTKKLSTEEVKVIEELEDEEEIIEEPLPVLEEEDIEDAEEEVEEQRNLQIKKDLGVTPEQNKLLKELYFDQGLMFGRDRLYQYIRTNFKHMNITRRQIASWLSCQQVSQLFKCTRRTKVIQPTVLSGPYQQVACDLADMQLHESDGYIYIFMMVDLFTKKCWGIPIKNKEAITVSSALETILTKFHKMPRVIRSDRGSEFIAEEFQAVLNKNNIKHILSLSHAPQSNGQIERTNGIIKKMIAMYKVYHNNYKWNEYLELLIGNYNNTISRVTKFTPNKAEVATEEEIKIIHDRIYKAVMPNREIALPKFKVGDSVRMKLDFSNEGNFVKKGVSEKWTREIFEVAVVTVSKSKVSLPHYLVRNIETDIIYSTRLYDNDLQLAEVVENPIKQDTKFRVTKIISRMNNPITHEIGFLVKWTSSDPTWVSYKSLNEDLPKLVKRFEINE
jgi:transposase InsO family protein